MIWIQLIFFALPLSIATTHTTRPVTPSFLVCRPASLPPPSLLRRRVAPLPLLPPRIHGDVEGGREAAGRPGARRKGRARNLSDPLLFFFPFLVAFSFPCSASPCGLLARPLIRRGTRVQPRERARASACDSAASGQRVIIWARGSSGDRGIFTPSSKFFASSSRVKFGREFCSHQM